MPATSVFPHGHLSWTPPAGTSGFRYKNVTPRRKFPLFDVTPGYQRYNDHRREPKIDEYMLSGWVWDNANFRGPYAPACTITLSPYLIRADQWSIHKRWAPIDVSAPGDADVRNWRWMTPLHYIKFSGWVEGNTGPGVDTDQPAITIDNDIVGTITADETRMETFELSKELTDSGHVPVKGSGRFSGRPVYTPGSLDMSWLYPDTTSVSDRPVAGTFVMDLNPGESVTGLGLMYDVIISTPAVRGGDLKMRASMKVSKE